MHGAHYVVAGKECKEFFFKSPDPFPHELERLPERLFISLKEDFIDVQQNNCIYGLAFESVVDLCAFMFIKAYWSKNN